MCVHKCARFIGKYLNCELCAHYSLKNDKCMKLFKLLKQFDLLFFICFPSVLYLNNIVLVKTSYTHHFIFVSATI